MKHCTACGKELPKPLDEYGLTGEELCFHCYFYGPDFEQAFISKDVEIASNGFLRARGALKEDNV